MNWKQSMLVCGLTMVIINEKNIAGASPREKEFYEGLIGKQEGTWGQEVTDAFRQVNHDK